MMAKATVIFSDGSKRMAHNVDDLYLRWEARRESILANLNDDFLPKRLYVRDCENVSDPALAVIYIHELISQKQDVEAWLATIKVQYAASHYAKSDPKFYQLKSLAKECDRQIVKLKGQLDGLGIIRHMKRYQIKAEIDPLEWEIRELNGVIGILKRFVDPADLSGLCDYELQIITKHVVFCTKEQS